MIAIRRTAVFGALALIISFSATAGTLIAPSLNDVLNFSKAEPSVNDAKLQAIREAGLKSGAQAGMINRARELIEKINARSKELDQVFWFQGLLDENGFLPPVIASTMQQVETLSSAQRIEYAGLSYKIVSPARFVRVVPTWRDYIYAGIGDSRLVVDELPVAIRPKTAAEKEAWENSVRSGWDAGIKQADAIFSENMAMLKREYMGMLKYISLRDAGMISRPVLAKTRDSIHVTHDEIAIGAGVMEISQPSKMETDLSAWGDRNGN